MTFGRYLLALLIPPLYLYTRSRWIAGTLNLIVWLIAWAMLISIVLAPISPVPWLICAMNAVWDVRRRLLEEHATMLAQKIAGAMQPLRPTHGLESQ